MGRSGYCTSGLPRAKTPRKAEEKKEKEKVDKTAQGAKVAQGGPGSKAGGQYGGGTASIWHWGGNANGVMEQPRTLLYVGMPAGERRLIQGQVDAAALFQILRSEKHGVEVVEAAIIPRHRSATHMSQERGGTTKDDLPDDA
ncbi:hypothetical protein CTRI78_v004870 [Colletotrichum trifolii]|uniref:Uncharacterized protein n=1 Tax=Colletotrichum trifolii TaxID=5466 RepID=A0A4R8RG62_COLTR|nr:hypothetical protein CTRI78_v004870 [Colletotrichum trifolii]